MLSHQHRNTLPPNNSYRILLRRISKSLSTEEVNDLCYLSQEAQAAGLLNKINFNGTVLFKFFEQRMLISHGNLDYLRDCLQSIERIDLCKLIDNYMNGPCSSHSKPLAQPHSSFVEQHLQSSYGKSFVKPHPQSLYVAPKQRSSNVEPHYGGPHPQSYVNPQSQSNMKTFPPPEFCDSIQLPTSPHLPAQPTPSMNASQPRVQRISKFSQPIQVEDREQYDSLTMLYGIDGYQKGSGSMQADYFTKVNDNRMMPSAYNSEHELNKKLKVELTNKDNEIKDLMKQINGLQQLLQEKEQNQCDSEQIIEHCQAQVEEVLAQGESRVAAERYEMKSKPHGIAVIINNFEFHSINTHGTLPARAGSEIDEDNLRVMWKYLRYDVRVLRNLTGAELSRQLLKIVAEDHKSFDSFVCCILSHGEGDGVYGTDGQLVKISDLAGLFKGTNHYCPSLVNKPKLFFVQACRGNEKDQAVSLEERDCGDLLEDALRNSLPSQADFLFAYSTPPGHVAWMSPRYGSWYISKLREVFMNNACHHDLLSMLTMVNKELSEAYTTEGYKQCPAPVTLLRKQVWFLGNT